MKKYIYLLILSWISWFVEMSKIKKINEEETKCLRGDFIYLFIWNANQNIW